MVASVARTPRENRSLPHAHVVIPATPRSDCGRSSCEPYCVASSGPAHYGPGVACFEPRKGLLPESKAPTHCGARRARRTVRNAISPPVPSNSMVPGSGMGLN